jgi:hypothetical protein
MKLTAAAFLHFRTLALQQHTNVSLYIKEKISIDIKRHEGVDIEWHKIGNRHFTTLLYILCVGCVDSLCVS